MKSRRKLLLAVGSLCSAGLAGCTNLPLPYIEYYDNDPPTLEEKRRFAEDYREAYGYFQTADSLYQSAASIYDSSSDYGQVMEKSLRAASIFSTSADSFGDVLYDGPEIEDSQVRRWTYNGREKSLINHHAGRNLANAAEKALNSDMDRAGNLRRHAEGLRDRSNPMEMGQVSEVIRLLEIGNQEDK